MKRLLVIDDGEQSAIIYKKSEYTNNVEYKMSLKELYEIYNKQHDDIFNYPTKYCISLILDNGNEISLDEYDETEMVPLFLKINDDILRNEGADVIIALHKNHYIMDTMWWQVKCQDVLGNGYGHKNTQQVLTKDLNGYVNCLKIIKNTNGNLVNTPALKYCHDIVHETENATYQGYLPSIGQMKFIFDNIDLINFIITCIIGSGLINTHTWWTSSEIDNYYVWGLSEFNKPNTIYKSGPQYVLPLFEKILKDA